MIFKKITTKIFQKNKKKLHFLWLNLIMLVYNYENSHKKSPQKFAKKIFWSIIYICKCEEDKKYV